MSPDDSHRSALAAGREVINRSREYLASGTSFSIETTLSGKWILATIREAIEHNFVVHLVFVCVVNSERSIRRVRERVGTGGHNVPDDDIRRRYDRSLELLPQALKLVSTALLYDNSDAEPRLVIELHAGRILAQSLNPPDWAKPFLTHLS